MKKPAKPIKTLKPAKVSKPTSTAQPAKAAKPVKLLNPASTTKPAKATKPFKAAKPVKAAKLVNATKSASPTKPAKAAKPAMTTKPTTVAVAASSTAQPSKMTQKTASEFKNFSPYVTAKGEEYMNEVQKEHFRTILRNWRSELMTEVDRTVSHMKDEAANFPDPADRATQEEEFSLELRTRDRERKLIKKIESTLDLIDQNDYGFCDACGVDIGIKRLEARPTATLCIDCKTLEEIKERQERG